jgi:hypothetical protein
MKYFKNIKILKSNPLHKEIETFNKDKSFKLLFVYENDKIKVKFIKSLSFKGKTFFEKVKDCYRILTNKPFTLTDEFEFKDGKHVVDVSDMLYILSKKIKKEIF